MISSRACSFAHRHSLTVDEEIYTEAVLARLNIPSKAGSGSSRQRAQGKNWMPARLAMSGVIETGNDQGQDEPA